MTYGTPALSAALNLPMRKVLSWIERGYIQPSVQEAKGHGSKRLFSEADLTKAKILLEIESVLRPSILKRICRGWYRVEARDNVPRP